MLRTLVFARVQADAVANAFLPIEYEHEPLEPRPLPTDAVSIDIHIRPSGQRYRHAPGVSKASNGHMKWLSVCYERFIVRTLPQCAVDSANKMLVPGKRSGCSPTSSVSALNVRGMTIDARAHAKKGQTNRSNLSRARGVTSSRIIFSKAAPSRLAHVPYLIWRL